MKCSGENVILRGIFHVVSRFPPHFMLYRGNFDYFSNSGVIANLTSLTPCCPWSGRMSWTWRWRGTTSSSPPSRRYRRRGAPGTSITSSYQTKPLNYSTFTDLFASGGRFPSLPWDFLQYHTIILQCFRIIVEDARFEPGTPLTQKSDALSMSHHNSHLTL